MAAALALLALPSFEGRIQEGFRRAAGWAFAFGAGLFAVSLYLMALTQWRWLGAFTPLGGLFLMAGFLQLALAALRRPSAP